METYTGIVKSSLEAKYTELQLREMNIRKWLNKNYKVSLMVNNKSLQKINKFVGFSALRNWFSLKEIEMFLTLADQIQTDKMKICMGTGIYVTLYVK